MVFTRLFESSFIRTSRHLARVGSVLCAAWRTGAGLCLEELAGVSYLDSGIEAAAIRAGSDAVYWYMSLLSSEIPSDKGSVQSILRQRFRELDPVFREIIAATKPEDTRFDELFERDPLPTWGAGRMTLLGDAAHP